MITTRIKLDLNDQNLHMVSKLQIFTYRCIDNFGPDRKYNYGALRKEEYMGIWATKLFKEYDYKIIFNETLWLPEKPEDYENVVSIKLCRTPDFMGHQFSFNTIKQPIFDIEWEWANSKQI